MNLVPTPLGFGPRMGGSMFRQSPFTASSMNGHSNETPKRKELGENDQQWFAKAKAEIAQYDDLWGRTQRINDAAYRAKLAAKYHTAPEDENGVLFRRNAVAYNVGIAESQTPVNYALYQDPKQQERVTKLEQLNEPFRQDVESGEQQFGILSEAAEVGQPAPAIKPETPPWLIPAGVGLGVLILGAILFSGD